MLIQHATVIARNALRPDYSVRLEGDTISSVRPSSDLPPEPGEPVLDATGAFLAPGFIDLHIHGTGPYLVDRGPADLEGLCRLLPQYGVTGFLPTVCPLPAGQDADFLSSLATVRPAGARILGWHLEGPFLSLTGALPEEALGSADPRRVSSLIDAAGPYPAIFSVSPDFPGILDLLPLMAHDHTPVFMTHTQADVEQTRAAMAAGVRHATHFYDVFPAPPQREPGVRPCGAVEAVLAEPSVSVDFILDGVHVDPVAVRMALECKGPDRVCLITDANIGAGMPPGRYTAFGDFDVEFHAEGAPARLTEDSHMPGALAGSGLTLDRAVRNAMTLLGVNLARAVRMVSANPAHVLGRQNQLARVAEGFAADLVLLNSDLQVTQTWVAGETVYKKGACHE